MAPDTFGDEVVIAAAARTPLGAFQGAFTGVPATKLGAVGHRRPHWRGRALNPARWARF